MCILKHSFSNISVGKWNAQSSKLLKNVFHDVDSYSKALKNKWQKIANTVNSERDYSFSAEQCRLKIKGLKSKYKRQKKKNNTSGLQLLMRMRMTMMFLKNCQT
jgi:hypothetical protein